MALLTIIPEAYTAVRKVFGLDTFEMRNGVQWAFGSVPSRGRPVTVVSGMTLDRENVAAATFADAMLDAWRPRHLLLVDIGGAVGGRDDVQVGDVIIHTRLHYYDFRKETGARTASPRELPHAAPSARLRELSRRPTLRGDESWRGFIPYRRPGRGRPKILEGEMLVGGTLFADSPRLHRLLRDHPKVLAVEMEGIGAARAVLEWGLRGDPPEFLVIRGMSDFCNVPPSENQSTRDRWKLYAAGSAAAHARALVSEMTLPPPPDDGQLRFKPRNEPLDNLWQVPLANLTGRDNTVEKLVTFFSTEDRPSDQSSRHALYGGPGMGKSALARRLAEELAQQFQVRWWVDAADELKIRAGLRELARQLGIPSACIELGSEGDQEGEAHRYLSDLRAYLASGMLSGRALVILDNVDDPLLKHAIEAKALRYLPPPRCCVLLTSQSGRWSPLADVTQVVGLSPDAGARLIAGASRRPGLEKDCDVRSLAEIFDGRPLLLKQIAVLIRDGDTPTEVLQRFAAAPEEALQALPELEGFDPLWRPTLHLALQRADCARAGARRLLEAVCCWSAEPIPPRLIGSLKYCPGAPLDVESLLNTLVDRCLMERQEGSGERTYTVHRTVAALVRALAHERGQLIPALAWAIAAAEGAIPDRDVLRRPAGQQMMIALSPHVGTLTERFLHFLGTELPSNSRVSAAECASLLGLHHRTSSEWAAAEQASRNAVALSDAFADPGGTALRKFRLANVLRQRGKFTEAERLVHEAAPDLSTHADPCDHAWGITVEARILRHRSRSSPAEALERLQDARSILERSPRGAEPSVVRQMSELHGYTSVLLRQLSQLNAAEAESEAGLRLVNGGAALDDLLHAPELPNEPLLATHLRALGGVWRLRGDFERASLAHHRALEVFERVYGPDHTDVCRALDSLGRVQREWGALEEALNTFERARRIGDAHFGPGNARAGTGAVNLALTYLELGQIENAHQEAALGFDIYKHAYREVDDPDKLQNEATVWAMFVRSEALAARGDLDDAIIDHQRVLAWRQSRLRQGHAHVASSLFALADIIWKRDGEESRATILEYHREALRIRCEVFGNSPNFWLSQSQARLGALTGNADMVGQALDFYTKRLKPGHWRTKAATETLLALHGNQQTPRS